VTGSNDPGQTARVIYLPLFDCSARQARSARIAPDSNLLSSSVGDDKRIPHSSSARRRAIREIAGIQLERPETQDCLTVGAIPALRSRERPHHIRRTSRPLDNDQ
jgi:hypothetical protein